MDRVIGMEIFIKIILRCCLDFEDSICECSKLKKPKIKYVKSIAPEFFFAILDSVFFQRKGKEQLGFFCMIVVINNKKTHRSS